VADLINEDYGEWNVQLVNDIFLPFEAQQIVQIPILHAQRDKFVWWEIKESEFTVKSAYHFLKHKKEVQQSNQSILPQHSKVWSKLWKVRTIPRHNYLVWRIQPKLYLEKHPTSSTKSEDYTETHSSSVVLYVVFVTRRMKRWSIYLWNVNGQDRYGLYPLLGVKFGYSEDSPKCFLEWLEHVIIHEEKDVIQVVMAICYA